ncbi:MAG: HAD family phosphatase [Blautia sp.]|nr:HAD family phosphatase [Blautia sp.]
MKNYKRYLAILGIILLLLLFFLPMVFAAGKTEGSRGRFMASVVVMMLLPIVAFAIMIVYKTLQGKNGHPVSSRKVDNIVFDLGKVLLDYDWETYLRSYHYPRKKYDDIADATFRSPVWEERDRGLLSEEEYLQKMIALAPEYERDIRKVMENSGQTIHIRDYAATWVKYLKNQGYRVYVLSNYSARMREQTLEEMQFLKELDGAIFSCDVNLLKPEKAIYDTLLEQFGLNPKKTVFIDDRQENCDGAEQAGIHAICFRDFAQAAGELEKLGVV